MHPEASSLQGTTELGEPTLKLVGSEPIANVGVEDVSNQWVAAILSSWAARVGHACYGLFQDLLEGKAHCFRIRFWGHCLLLPVNNAGRQAYALE